MDKKQWSKIALVWLLATVVNDAAAAQVPVKIGVLADMSGLYSDIGGKGSLDATRMAIEDFQRNTGGSALKIEVISADAQNKPDVSSSIARQWLDAEGVDVLVDLPTSSVSLAIAPLVRDKNKVALFTTSGTSELTGKACTPNTVHWTYDSWSLAHATAGTITKAGGTTWFFLTVDYAIGYALESDAAAVVTKAGGKVLGSIRHPLDTKDLSSYILRAQSSGAKVIMLANAGGDLINAIKQSSEFGIVEGGQKLAAMLIFLSDIHSLGLKAAQGLQFSDAFYWDFDDSTRQFSKRFAERNNGRYPTMAQAGAYSSTLSYLRAVAKVGSAKDGAAVVKAMRDEGEFQDPLFGRTWVRRDGRAVHRMMLVEVKKPSESKGPWDYYKILDVIPPEQAFKPLDQSDCPLVSR